MTRAANIPARPGPTKLKPGWAMTPDQHDLFWRVWASACRGQGWTALPAAEQNAKRREVLSALGFSSAKHIDTRQGFDDVKQRLEALAGKVHNERADAGARRRILSRIGQSIAELDQAGYPPRSIETILPVRFKVIKGVRTLPDLDTPELVNLSRTLSARLASWKQWECLVNALRSILFRLALCKSRPSPISQAAPCSAAGMAPAIAMQTFCSPTAEPLPRPVADLFFVGG